MMWRLALLLSIRFHLHDLLFDRRELLHRHSHWLQISPSCWYWSVHCAHEEGAIQSDSTASLAPFLSYPPPASDCHSRRRVCHFGQVDCSAEKRRRKDSHQLVKLKASNSRRHYRHLDPQHPRFYPLRHSPSRCAWSLYSMERGKCYSQSRHSPI